MVGLIIDGAVTQAREIVQENRDDMYIEGENALHDNANRLMTFLTAAKKEIQEDM